MPSTAEAGLLSTVEASRLVDRPESSVRRAIAARLLDAENLGGRWMIRYDDLVAWDQHTRRHRRASRPSSADHSAQLLASYPSLSAEELSILAGIHVGNARKHLAILAKQGRARRMPDGQWVLINDQQQGAA